MASAECGVGNGEKGGAVRTSGGAGRAGSRRVKPHSMSPLLAGDNSEPAVCENMPPTPARQSPQVPNPAWTAIAKIGSGKNLHHLVPGLILLLA